MLVLPSFLRPGDFVTNEQDVVLFSQRLVYEGTVLFVHPVRDVTVHITLLWEGRVINVGYYDHDGYIHVIRNSGERSLQHA